MVESKEKLFEKLKAGNNSSLYLGSEPDFIFIPDMELKPNIFLKFTKGAQISVQNSLLLFIIKARASQDMEHGS